LHKNVCIYSVYKCVCVSVSVCIYVCVCVCVRAIQPPNCSCKTCERAQVLLTNRLCESTYTHTSTWTRIQSLTHTPPRTHTWTRVQSHMHTTLHHASAGKSTFSQALERASSSMFVRVNQDTINSRGKPGTRAQCVKAARAALAAGKCVVIDRFVLCVRVCVVCVCMCVCECVCVPPWRVLPTVCLMSLL